MTVSASNNSEPCDLPTLFRGMGNVFHHIADTPGMPEHLIEEHIKLVRRVARAIEALTLLVQPPAGSA